MAEVASNSRYDPMIFDIFHLNCLCNNFPVLGTFLRPSKTDYENSENDQLDTTAGHNRPWAHLTLYYWQAHLTLGSSDPTAVQAHPTFGSSDPTAVRHVRPVAVFIWHFFINLVFYCKHLMTNIDSKSISKSPTEGARGYSVSFIWSFPRWNDVHALKRVTSPCTKIICWKLFLIL